MALVADYGTRNVPELFSGADYFSGYRPTCLTRSCSEHCHLVHNCVCVCASALGERCDTLVSISILDVGFVFLFITAIPHTGAYPCKVSHSPPSTPTVPRCAGLCFRGCQCVLSSSWGKWAVKPSLSAEALCDVTFSYTAMCTSVCCSSVHQSVVYQCVV